MRFLGCTLSHIRPFVLLNLFVNGIVVSTTSAEIGQIARVGGNLHVTFPTIVGSNYGLEGTTDFKTWALIPTTVHSGTGAPVTSIIDQIGAFPTIGALQKYFIRPRPGQMADGFDRFFGASSNPHLDAQGVASLTRSTGTSGAMQFAVSFLDQYMYIAIPAVFGGFTSSGLPLQQAYGVTIGGIPYEVFRSTGNYDVPFLSFATTANVVRLYGVSSDASLDAGGIAALTESKGANSSMMFTVSPQDQFIYLAVPASLGAFNGIQFGGADLPTEPVYSVTIAGVRYNVVRTSSRHFGTVSVITKGSLPRFFGVSSDPSLGAAGVGALASSPGTNAEMVFSVTPQDEYIYVAIPVAFDGLSSISDSVIPNFPINMIPPYHLTISGTTYLVYRSIFPIDAPFTILTR